MTTTLYTVLRHKNFDALRTIPAQSLWAELGATLEQMELDYQMDPRCMDYLDCDRLHMMGIQLVRAGHEGVDSPVAAWAAARPSIDRLCIAANLLRGLWMRDLRSKAPASAAIQALATARDAVLATSVHENAAFMALCVALAALPAGPVAADLQGYLDREAQRPGFDDEERRFRQNMLKFRHCF